MSSHFPRHLGRMDERVAVVTGGSSGIGAAITKSFLEVGARVHVIARHPEDVIDQIGAGPVDDGSCVLHAIDVSDAAAVNDLAGYLRAHDPVDTLVCAAGTNIRDRRPDQLTDAAWDNLIQVNLNGVFYILRAVLDQIRDRQGDLVVIASVSAVWPDQSGAAYAASKAALLGLARGVAFDEHTNGVRVTSILPGLVDTAILDRRAVPPTAELRAAALQPSDVAAACLTAVTLPARANIAELTIVPTRLQALGKTQAANPDLS